MFHPIRHYKQFRQKFLYETYQINILNKQPLTERQIQLYYCSYNAKKYTPTQPFNMVMNIFLSRLRIQSDIEHQSDQTLDFNRYPCKSLWPQNTH